MMPDPGVEIPLKVLFLDIDGVLKPVRAYWLQPHKADGNR
jgi:hypothetical protein